jgi:dGTPase
LSYLNYPTLLQTGYNVTVKRRENIRFLRGKAINELMDIAVDSFIKHEDELLTGSFDTSLLDDAPEEMKKR